MSIKQFYKGRRILVTGDTGFKGSWLAFWLDRLGAEVHGLALEPDTDPSNFEILGLRERLRHRTVDIRDFAALRDAVRSIEPEVVFHLAAQAIVRVSYEEPLDTLRANVMGTAHLLQAVRESGYSAARPCTVVCITSDKCYENRETYQAYREIDPMGGHDPYSMSKGAAELVISSWRRSFFPPSAWADHGVLVASARAGNVMGGGDWAPDRIVVDSVRALTAGRPVAVRNPGSIRPWQHVLEPLSGYLQLGAELAMAAGKRPEFASAYNFGPGRDAERPVRELVDLLVRHWGKGSWESSQPERFSRLHEAVYLKLATDKAWHHLGWKPSWDFERSVRETVKWYRRAYSEGFGSGPMRKLTGEQIESYTGAAADLGLRWAGELDG
jgi:CDP-glucose 4,6-dehydratase